MAASLRLKRNLKSRIAFLSVAWLAWCGLTVRLTSAEAVRFGFAGPEIFPVESQIGQLRAADFDGDGKTDLLVVNNPRSRINVLLNQTGQTNTAPRALAGARRQLNELPPDARFRIESIPSEKRIFSLAAADLNDDGRTDIAYYGEPKELVAIFNLGTNRWSPPRRWQIEDGQLHANALSHGDINGDSRTDLVLLGENHIYALTQTGKNDLAEPRRIPFSGVARSLQVTDLNHDRKDDLLIVNWEDRNPFRFRLQQAAGEFTPEVYVPLSPIRAYWADTLEDANKLRIVSISQNSGRASVFSLQQEAADNISPGISEGQLKVVPFERTSKARRGILWVDVNSDERPDLVVADPEKAQVTFYYQDESGSPHGERSFPSLAGITDMAAADWDQDGVQELFVLSPDERQVGLSRIDPEKGLEFPTMLPVPGRPLVLAAGRLAAKAPPVLAAIADEDGKRSLLLLSSNNVVRRISLSESFRGNPASMRFHDADQDGKTDILILIPYEKIKILRQQDSLKFAEIDVAPPGGMIEHAWLGAADLDADGKLEMLAPNRNFLRAFVLERQASTGEDGESQGWGFRIKDQINGADGTSRIIAACVTPMQESKWPAVFMLDPERKAVTLCRKTQEQGWSIIRNISLPVSDFSSLQAITLGSTNGTAVAFSGLNMAAILPLSGATWRLSEIDSYETPIRQGHLMDVTAGDLDNDGRKDLVFLETARNYVDLVAVKSDGKVEPANRWQVFEERTFRGRGGNLPEPREAVVADFTGDGKQDLAIIVHDRVLLYPQE